MSFVLKVKIITYIGVLDAIKFVLHAVYSNDGVVLKGPLRLLRVNFLNLKGESFYTI